MIKRLILLSLYYGMLRYFPESDNSPLGRISRSLRYLCCKPLFKKCGENVNIHRKAWFGTGKGIEIGDNSGIGLNCHIPSVTIIGRDVMMGPEVYILDANHNFESLEKPMIEQGHGDRQVTCIGNDVWIGRQVVFTPGKTIGNGCIVATGTVVTKTFDDFSIIGGNPSRLIRKRTDK